MGIDMDNVIEFPARAGEPTVLEFEIGIGSVDEARRTLEGLAATATLALGLIDQSTDDGATLVEILRLFDALATLIARDRGIVPACQFPRFNPPDPPDGAA
jgi:hypothetical protein